MCNQSILGHEDQWRTATATEKIGGTVTPWAASTTINGMLLRSNTRSRAALFLVRYSSERGEGTAVYAVKCFPPTIRQRSVCSSCQGLSFQARTYYSTPRIDFGTHGYQPVNEHAQCPRDHVWMARQHCFITLDQGKRAVQAVCYKSSCQDIVA